MKGTSSNDLFYNELKNITDPNKNFFIDAYTIIKKPNTPLLSTWEELCLLSINQPYALQELKDKDWEINQILENKVLNVQKKLNVFKQSKGLNIDRNSVDLFKSVVLLLSKFSIFYGVCGINDENKIYHILNECVFIVGSEFKNLLNNVKSTSESIRIVDFAEELYTIIKKCDTLLKSCVLGSKKLYLNSQVSKVILDLEKLLNPSLKKSESNAVLKKFDNFLHQYSNSYTKEYIEIYLNSIFDVCESNSMKSVIQHPEMNYIFANLLDIKNIFEILEKFRCKQYSHNLHKQQYSELLSLKSSENFSDDLISNDLSFESSILGENSENTILGDSTQNLKFITSDYINRKLYDLYSSFEIIYQFCGVAIDQIYSNPAVVQELALGSVLSVILSLTGRLYAKNLTYLTNLVEPYISDVRKSLKSKSLSDSSKSNELLVDSSCETRSKSLTYEKSKFLHKLHSSTSMTLLKELDTKLVCNLYVPSYKEKPSEFMKAPADRLNRFIIWLLYLGDPSEIFQIVKPGQFEKADIVKALISCVKKGFDCVSNWLSDCLKRFNSIPNATCITFDSPLDMSQKLYEVLQLRFFGTAESKLYISESAENSMKFQNGGMFNNLTKTLDTGGSYVSKIRVNDNLMKLILDFNEESFFYKSPIIFVDLPKNILGDIKSRNVNNQSYLNLMSLDLNFLLNELTNYGEISLLNSHKNYQKLTEIKKLNSDLAYQYQNYVKGTFDRHSHQLSTHKVRLFEQNSTISNNARVLATQKTIINKINKDTLRLDDMFSQVDDAVRKNDKVVSRTAEITREVHNKFGVSHKILYNEIMQMTEKIQKLEFEIQSKITSHKNNIRHTKNHIESLKNNLGNAENALLKDEIVLKKIQRQAENVVKVQVYEKLMDLSKKYQAIDLEESVHNEIKELVPVKSKETFYKLSELLDEKTAVLLDDLAFNSDETVKFDIVKKVESLKQNESVEQKVSNSLTHYTQPSIEKKIKKILFRVISRIIQDKFSKVNKFEIFIKNFISQLEKSYRKKLTDQLEEISKEYLTQIQILQNTLSTLVTQINLKISELLGTTKFLQETFVKNSSDILNSTVRCCREQFSQYMNDYLSDIIDLQTQLTADQLQKPKPPKFQLYENETLCNSLANLKQLEIL